MDRGSLKDPSGRLVMWISLGLFALVILGGVVTYFVRR
jgi:hypothetical protein